MRFSSSGLLSAATAPPLCMDILAFVFRLLGVAPIAPHSMTLLCCAFLLLSSLCHSQPLDCTVCNQVQVQVQVSPRCLYAYMYVFACRPDLDPTTGQEASPGHHVISIYLSIL